MVKKEVSRSLCLGLGAGDGSQSRLVLSSQSLAGASALPSFFTEASRDWPEKKFLASTAKTYCNS